MRPSADTTVRWDVFVPSQVTANGVVSGQPAAMSILPRSAGPASAPSTTSVPGVNATRLASAAWMMRTSPPSAPSGIPAYAGTAVAAGTPGTISSSAPASAYARASIGAAVQQGVPVVKPDRQLAGLGGRDQVGLLAARVVRGHEELGAGAQQLADPRPGLAGRDHHAGLADELGTAQGQQALVAGPRAHQRDAAGRGRRCLLVGGRRGRNWDGVHKTSFSLIVRTGGPVMRLPAPPRSNRAATSKPSWPAALGAASPRSRSA